MQHISSYVKILSENILCPFLVGQEKDEKKPRAFRSTECAYGEHIPSAPGTCLCGRAAQATAEHAERGVILKENFCACGRKRARKKSEFSAYHPRSGATERSRCAALLMTRLPPQRKNYTFSHNTRLACSATRSGGRQSLRRHDPRRGEGCGSRRYICKICTTESGGNASASLWVLFSSVRKVRQKTFSAKTFPYILKSPRIFVIINRKGKKGAGFW